jgi:hypothetical protein
MHPLNVFMLQLDYFLRDMSFRGEAGVKATFRTQSPPLVLGFPGDIKSLQLLGKTG